MNAILLVVLAALGGAADGGRRDLDRAIADLDRVIEANPDNAGAYQARGEMHFRAGQMRESIADFDRFLELRPKREPHHWQRGISYYYAGEYEKGVRQFESHKTVNPEDVENAIWHCLCKSKVLGPKKARGALIEITSDTRPWAMTVYGMYRGEVTAEEALARADRPGRSVGERRNNLFYTHLYVGLHYESLGRMDKALKHIRTAVEQYPSPHYMGEVAQVALKLRRTGDGPRESD